MKIFLESVKTALIITGIVLVARLYYQEGARETRETVRDSLESLQLEIDDFNGREWGAIPHVFTQDPPTIYTNCLQSCETKEYVTWEEYMRRYNETMRSHYE